MFTQQYEQFSRISSSTLTDSKNARFCQWRHTIEFLFGHGVHYAQELLNAVSRLLLLTFGNHVCIEAWNHANDLVNGTHIHD